MVIKDVDFIMTSNACDSFWDLELLQTVKPKNGPERQEFKDPAYGLPMTSCLKRIVNYRLGKKQDVYTLEEYVRDYKAQIDKLETLFKDM